jgi:hypothetical protein
MLTSIRLRPRNPLERWLIAAAMATLWPSSAHGQPTPPPCAATQQTFLANGVLQQWTVPAGVTQLTIDATGGQGGAGNGNPGGNGARLLARFPVTPGETLNVVVGRAGVGADSAGGGGGGSFVYRAATATGLLLAAAGGGGGSQGDVGIPGSANTTAANGEGSSGGTGGTAGAAGNGGGGGTNTNKFTGAGGGGLLTDGGSGSPVAKGGQALANGAAGGMGSLVGASGGFGGGGAGDAQVGAGGGGGGGGYDGGGGGAGFGSGVAGGGGGGSFVNSSGTTLFAQSGLQNGNGQVTICYSASPAAIPTVSVLGLVLLGIGLAALSMLRLRG